VSFNHSTALVFAEPHPFSNSDASRGNHQANVCKAPFYNGFRGLKIWRRSKNAVIPVSF
jgi:hypothetical protein